MPRTPNLWALCLALGLALACSDPAERSAAGDVDADAAEAADVPGESGADAAPDVPLVDVATDATPDVSSADATPDVPPADATPDVPPEVAPDTVQPDCTGDAQCAPGVCDLGRCWPAPAAQVDVPAGTFWMGCDGVRDTGCEVNGLGGYFDQPYHAVDVPAFAIDVFETTVAEYAHCVAAAACTLPEQQPECTWSAGEASNLPLTCVSWEQAGAYCTWRGARLCTESEWEKAARGGCDLLPADQRADCGAHQPLNPWGDAPATCDVAVMDPNDGSGAGCGAAWPLPVGSRPAGASPYGVHDTVGNVGEWVADCFDASYDGAPADGSARTQCVWPQGDWLSGQYRAHRGAGWNQAVWFQRGAQRGADPPMGTFTNVGIRCCVTP